MATYSATGYYLLSSAGGNNYTINGSFQTLALNAVDSNSNTTFEPNETIVMNGFIYGPFIGGGPDGAIINVTGNGVWYVTSNSSLASGSSVTSTPSAFVTCFLAGTRVATPDGFATVETLEEGDLVLTADGQAKPVKWLFVQTVTPVFSGLRTAPIRIAAGALGGALPARDLSVSADHALLIDDVLVQAGALVGAPGVTQETELSATYRYYHVELADHSLVLAEGVAAETFLSTDGRRNFDNWPQYLERFGDDQPASAELDMPRIKSARQLPAGLRARLGLGRKAAA